MKKVNLSVSYDGKKFSETFLMEDDAKDYEIADEAYARALDIAQKESLPYLYFPRIYYSPYGIYPCAGEEIKLLSTLDYDWFIEEI